MSPSATPATQSATASQATNPDQARHPVPSVPRLPRKTTVDVRCVPRLPRETKLDVTKCHACQAEDAEDAEDAEHGSTESKTRTPHKVVGKKIDPGSKLEAKI